MFGGIVIHGDGLGKKYGYPTANLDIKKIVYKEGVYAVYALFENKKYKAAMFLRENPLKMEVYLLEYRGEDFYGKFMEVDPVQKVSEVEKYDSEEELLEKIASDVVKVREVLK